MTNLNDSGAGQFPGVYGTGGARTILFTVNGIITLTTPITAVPDNVTVACHSAPGQGVLLRGNIKLWDTENIIMRYCRLRANPPTTAPTQGFSLVSPYAGVNNAIFDHLSVGWISDDAFGVTINSPGTQVANVTVQWSIFSESVTDPGGVTAGSGGQALASPFNATGAMKVSWLYNLYANVGKRVPTYSGRYRIKSSTR